MLNSPSVFVRDTLSRWALGLLLITLAVPGLMRAQSNTGGFDPGVNGTVYAVIVQPDGKILMGGAFSSVRPNGVPPIGRLNLVRFLPDGSLDATFDPNLNGAVYSLALQANGSILVAGEFTNLDPNRTGSPVARVGVARLNSDGTLDSGFNPNPSGDRTVKVFSIVVQDDGKVVFGGLFDGVQPGATGTVAVRNYLARVNSNGNLDAGFAPNPNNIVYSLCPQSGGRVIAGGGFTQLQPGEGTAVVEVGRLARFNSDGSVDPSFDLMADDIVRAQIFEADGSLILAGDFNKIQQGTAGAVFDRLALVRIRTDGTVDPDFRPNANSGVRTLAIQRDGRILVGGSFTRFTPAGTVGSLAKRYLARINPNGTLDTGFDVGPNYVIHAVAIQANDAIVAGGAFTRVTPVFFAGSIIRSRAARFDVDGSLDGSFSVDSGGEVTSLIHLADGNILAAGRFSSVAGITRYNLVKLDPNGIVIDSFSAFANNRVNDAVVDEQGRIVISGDFGLVNDIARPGVARLNADGTLDESFYPNPNAQVNSVDLASDGKIMIGGLFTLLTPNAGDEAFTHLYLARLNTDGTVDESYAPAMGGVIQVVRFQSDGKLLVGGRFSEVRPHGSETSQGLHNLVRFNPDGTLDNAFVPDPNGTVEHVVVQTDGKIILSGLFTGLHPGESIEVIDRRYLARVSADGLIDEGFDPNADDLVTAIFVDSVGRALIGGDFTFLQPHKEGDPIYRERVARLNPDGSVDETLDLAANDQVQSFMGSGADVLIGGQFTSIRAYTGNQLTIKGRIARLSSSGDLASSFKVRASNADGNQVAAMAPQSDGTILVGGTFSELGGGANRNVARIFSDGVLDPSFSSRVNGPVHTILSLPDIRDLEQPDPLLAILNQDGSYATLENPVDGSLLDGDIRILIEQADGKMIVGGDFTDGNLAIGPYIARYNADGSLDTAFSPRLNGSVSAIALQSDGKILIGGLFTEIDGTARNRIARLNSDGTVDGDFDPNASGEVLDIVLQSDNKILIGGSFTGFEPNGGEPVIRSRMARLLVDGTVDADFNPTPDERVYTIAIDADGLILIGGDFETLAPGGGDIIARSRLARITDTGALDETFNPATSDTVLDLAVQADGKILVGGNFLQVLPVGTEEVITRQFIARFNADGTIDPVFDPEANGSVAMIHIQADQQILVGGSFNTFTPNAATFAVVRNRIARLQTNGVPDSGFSPSSDGVVQAIIDRADGTIAVGGAFNTLERQSAIYLGGNFSTINDARMRNLARVDGDGSPDIAFNPQPDRPVDGLVYQPDGHVIVVGQFSLFNGESRNRIARIDSFGQLEAGFDPDANGVVSAAALQPDGKIIVGGDFTTIGGVVRRRLARLHNDGTLDTTFSADTDAKVMALAVRPDGSILVGGSFTSVGGVDRPSLALLQSDGSVVAGFNPAPDGPVSSLAVQTDGSVLVGGSFSTIAGEARTRVAKLTPSGSLDPTFDVSVNGSVQSILMLESGRPFLGGGFTQVADEARYLTVRLAPTSVAVDRIEVNSGLTQITWIRQGSLPEITAAYFSISEDGREWTLQGAGSRSSSGNGWEITLTESLPASEYFFVKVDGVQPTTGMSSSGAIRSVSRFYGSIPAGPSSAGQEPQESGAADQNGGSAGSGGSSGSDGGTDPDGSSGSAGSTGSSFPWSELPDPEEMAFTNLSARVKLGVQDSFITGFSIDGTAIKPVLLRAVGPGLAAFGIDDHAPAPQLEVYDASGHVVAQAGAWNGDSALISQFAHVGAFPLSVESADAVLRVDLEPGAYTVRVSDVSGLPGVVLAEIYDLENEPAAGQSRLVNISSRGPVSIGSGVATGGFHLAGDQSAVLLVRAVGPGLSQFSVPDAIADPVVKVYDSEGTALAENDDWGTPLMIDTAYPGYVAQEMVEAAIRTGAFSLVSGSSDGVVLIELEPGTYTVQARSEDGSEGEAIFEIYLVQ